MKGITVKAEGNGKLLHKFQPGRCTSRRERGRKKWLAISSAASLLSHIAPLLFTFFLFYTPFLPALVAKFCVRTNL